VQGFPDVHPALDALQVNRRRQVCLGDEMLGRCLVTFDDEIVEDEAVQVTETFGQLAARRSSKDMWESSDNTCKVFSHQVIQRDSQLWFIREWGRKEVKGWTKVLTVWTRSRREVGAPTPQL
jgi:hypothetical protein